MRVLAMRLALLLLLAAGACVRPSGWDARTDGGRRPPDPHKTPGDVQPGVEDMRSGSQGVGFGFGRGC